MGCDHMLTEQEANVKEEMVKMNQGVVLLLNKN